MTTRARLEAQAALARAHEADQQARPNEPPAPPAPEACRHAPDGCHTWSRRRTDGARFCFSCGARNDPDGRLVMIGDPAW